MNKQIANGSGNPVSVEGEDKFFKQLDSLVPTAEERKEIVEAGVPVAEQHLKEVTPRLEHKYKSQDYLFNKKRDPNHLKNSVSHMPGQFATGGTEVGYVPSAAPIARWVDHGTYRQGPQFFFERGFNTLNTDKLFSLQSQKAKQIVKAKGIYTD